MKGPRARARGALAGALALSLVAACATQELGRDVAATEKEYSGFLEDYSKLEKHTDSHGNETMRWVSPDLNGKNYQKILVSEPVFFPAPKETAQVSLAVLNEIRDYARQSLSDGLGRAGLLSHEPGPGVVRLDIAMTGVSSREQNLQAWELIPVALIKAGVKGATGTRAREVRMYVESEAADSVTNRVVGESVREATGVPLKGGQDKLTLEHIKPKLDEWTDSVVTELVRLLQ